MKVDPDWPWGPTNNFCKWFHVCEHESNHNGQIKWIEGPIAGVSGLCYLLVAGAGARGPFTTTERRSPLTFSLREKIR